MRLLVFTLVLTLVIGSAFVAPAADAAEGKPNILWITAEDMSPTLGCYGDEYATSPNIDRLATESVRYTHAFATAPVCSPSRSCLITGCYAPSLGTHQMRSAFPIPEFMTGFPSELRQQLDYYTTNNVKTDYNTANWEKIVAASWNESSDTAHWRKRSDEQNDQPFFSVFNLMTSHQSRTMVWPYEQFQSDVQSRLSADEKHDPGTVPLPPYYVDTPVVRRELARYYDCVTAMDQEVGRILEQLESDGLADNTIVFFYSDHGSGMPRHKRALFDSGMHVPLLIRFPEKWRHLAPANPGETLDRLVSFVDFGPTVLSLAGAEIPDFMQGQPFLGDADTEPREFVYGHRDRVDEVRDLARSVRDKRWLYIRNFMPHLGYNQPTSWPDQGAIRHEFYRLTDREKMTDAQWQFAGPTRPVEELYDCQADPLNLNNLANDPQQNERLSKLRDTLFDHLFATRDFGFIAESEAWRMTSGTTPWGLTRGYGTSQEQENATGSVISSISAAFSFSAKGQERDLSLMLSGETYTGYWDAIALNSVADISAVEKTQLSKKLNHTSAAIRIEAANTLIRHGHPEAALEQLITELASDDLTSVLHTIRTVEMLPKPPAEAVPAVEKLIARCEIIRPPDTPPTVVTAGDQDLAMFIMMSANAFLKKAGAEAGARQP